MFNQRTVFIVGAGASREYAMPLGSTLASTIADNVRFAFEQKHVLKHGDAELYKILRLHNERDEQKLDCFVRAGHDLAAAVRSSTSIDDALFQLSETPEAIALGKIAIVRAILAAEANSGLSLRNGRLDEDAGRDGWIEQFFSMAVANVKRQDFAYAFQNVQFVNFNYDRCIEHYLYWSLRRLGGSEGDAWCIVEDLSIISLTAASGRLIRTIRTTCHSAAMPMRLNL